MISSEANENAGLENDGLQLAGLGKRQDSAGGRSCCFSSPAIAVWSDVLVLRFQRLPHRLANMRLINSVLNETITVRRSFLPRSAPPIFAPE